MTLTLNLLADSETDAHGAGPAADLAHCLTEHFTTPAMRRYGRTDLDPPNRLVYLLDHEYTQRGLNWNRLKGVDAERAALLRAAAPVAQKGRLVQYAGRILHPYDGKAHRRGPRLPRRAHRRPRLIPGQARTRLHQPRLPRPATAAIHTQRERGDHDPI